ncbi:Ntn hydrolase family protein [Telluribacter humicola]|uniref:hypothetical protein n=1 Tax=Telluribacter humicola TaxID=1720261 RepID=UPI001A96D45E|nr:hypothetical protein [Telluribacter humicola]
MTCIVGLIENESVYIGGDSAGVDGLDIIIRKDPKVFKVGEFVFGCTSSFRMMQLVRFSFFPPTRPPEMDVYEYMCTSFVNALRTTLRNGGHARIKEGEEEGGCFLVGYVGRLFIIEEDYDVGESIDRFASVGCGSPYALGAMTAMERLKVDLSAREKVTTAISIACNRSGGVRPPFVIEHT